MGRKVRRKLGPPLPRAARSLRTPRFTRGDVLATMDPDTWIGGKVRTSYYRLMWAAIAALLACARVTLCRASCLTLADYEAMCLTFTRKNDRSYPIILLPVAVEVMERYLVHRRKLGGTALFVGAKANRITHDVMTAAFIRLGKLYRLEGGEI